MHRVVLTTGLAIALLAPRESVAQDRPSGPRRLTFGKPTQLLRNVELNYLADVVFGAAGVAFVLDGSNYQVFAVDSAGGMIWRTGGKGSGPGEFTLPIRIAARPHGGVAVLDWGNGRMTLLSPAGKPDASLMLPFTFTQIDGMMILPDGRFVIAAMTSRHDSDASNH